MSAADEMSQRGGWVTETDVSAWAVIRDEPGGRDPNKRWVAPDADSPRHEHWLWKSRQPTGGGEESALTDCAEVAVSLLAAALGVPAAECRYAVCDNELGLISRNVAPEGYSLNTGRTYLPEIDGYVRLPEERGAAGAGRMRLDQGYTIEAVEAVLEAVEPPPGVVGFTAFGVFAGYLVLDALVGNSDRHPGNWALLESSDGTRHLAPTYDHGTALGAGLTDRNRQTRDPVAFARRGRANPFTPARQSLVDLALDAIRRADARVWLERVGALDEDLVGATMEAPGGRLSVGAAMFMKQVVLENRRRLCDGNPA
ncbi:hypothetical protein GJV82_19055 [Cellulosimicrobium sp. BIT-GX5]|uniref:HipA-like C-terminal domain-containing protein n=1 Tax=Cellulosimicrobium composti TaxID=2672572 RepID=A0A6N7ZNK6_9MICO|nr:HipA domain-containing protein [Cellulosimicrobium composti]MTG91017.1 hypothetical protein [Cellulosimicrobium composti]